jgi:hypothetical protein
MEAIDPETGSGGEFSLGRGERLASGGLSESAVRERVLPSLQRAIGAEHDRQVLRALLLALSRLEASWARPRGIDSASAVEFYLERGPPELLEASLVALGVARRTDRIELLAKMLLASPRADEPQPGPGIDYRLQSMAALGLGLAAERGGAAGRHKAAAALLECLRGPATAPYDLQVACLIALGLSPVECCSASPRGQPPAPDHLCRSVQIGFLSSYLQDPKRHARLRAQAAVPLARLARGAAPVDREAVGAALIDGLGLDARGKASPEVRQGCAMALGIVGDADDDALDHAIRDSLERAVKGAPDGFTRNLALISLARVAARPGSGEGAQATLERVQSLLLEHLARGRGQSPEWAAIALGVLGCTLAENGLPAPPEVAAALRMRLGGRPSASLGGALCVALGLLRDPAAGEVLHARLRKAGEPATRAHAALSLGLCGVAEAAETLEQVLSSALTDAELQREGALALRLLGAGDSLERVEQRALSSEGYLLERLRSVRSLGAAGRASSLPALLDLSAGRDKPAEVREAAAWALGELLDRSPTPWWAAITSDLHYALLSSTLYSHEGNGTGILEMR